MQIHRFLCSFLFCMLNHLLLSNIWHKAVTLVNYLFYFRSWTKYNRKNSGTFVHIVSMAIVPLLGIRTFYYKLRVSVRNFITTFMMNMLNANKWHELLRLQFILDICIYITLNRELFQSRKMLNIYPDVKRFDNNKLPIQHNRIDVFY